MRFVALSLLFAILLTIPAVNAKKIDGGKISIQTIYNTVTQGEKDWYCKYIKNPAFTLCLVWNNPSNSLTLTVYSPDGNWATFTYSSDGSIDGKIVITIYDATSGRWFFEVYGDKVNGKQPYSFTIT